MKRPISLKQSSSGFTLLEVLVVVIIIGVLAAIAAPGWLAFLNRQRLGRSSEQVVQAIRAAQAEAKRTSTYREVRFDGTVDPPRYAVVPVTSSYNAANNNVVALTLAPINAANVTNWERFGQGEIRPGILAMTVTRGNTTTNSGSIIFGPKGEVVRNTLAPSNPDPNNLRFFVTLSLQRTPAVRRCVFTASLLGAIRQGDGAACNP